MDPLKQLIEMKRQALKNAKAEVAALSEQIQALEAMKPTVHESVLIQTEVRPMALAQKPEEPVITPTAMPQHQEQQKNSKGSLTPVILGVLSDGNVRDMDQMLRDVNQRMVNPTTRDSLRSTLGALRKKGDIESPGYGKYSIQKGESPAYVVATNDNGGALNVQQSPLAGPQQS